MNIVQQRVTGNVYDMSHVFRVFFYWNVDFYERQKLHAISSDD